MIRSEERDRNSARGAPGGARRERHRIASGNSDPSLFVNLEIVSIVVDWISGRFPGQATKSLTCFPPTQFSLPAEDSPRDSHIREASRQTEIEAIIEDVVGD